MSLMEREEFGIEKIIQELQEAVDLGDAPKRGPFAVFVRKEYLVEAIDLLRTHQDNQQGDGWVSVKDRLPEFTGHYLLCITNTENSVAVVVSGVYFNDSKSFDFANVTHWRPLPEPPKEDNNA